MIELSPKISAYILEVFGENYLNSYRTFLTQKYPTSIRLNNDFQDSIINQLKNQGITLRENKSFPNAYEVIKGDNLIGKTVEHLLGYYYIQSLSSMIPPLVLNSSENDCVLDLCSAPGSKTTQIAEMMDFKGTLIANEPNLNRIKALVHNLDKMNALNIRVLKQKGELLSKRYSEIFDKILVDAPCSALGVIQKKQEVSNWWSSNTVQSISSLQLKLLVSAIKMAKKDGEIVYSTCTLTIEENEQIIDKVLKKYPVELVGFDLSQKHINGYTEINQFKFDESLSLTKRIIPWDINSEGFFIAKLKKISSLSTSNPMRVNQYQKKDIVVSTDKKIKKYLLNLSDYFGIEFKIFEKYKFILKGNDLNFTNIDSIDDDPDYYLRIGTKFGLIDKNDIIKLHSHAAQIIGVYATKNIIILKDNSEILNYFAGGSININECDRGQKLVKYRDKVIGMGVCIDGKLKSQFPRSKRTGSLIVPNISQGQ